MTRSLVPLLSRELKKLVQAGLYKRDAFFTPQSDDPDAARHKINFTGQDYLGLSNNAQVLQAAQAALSAEGFGQASSRMTRGTRKLHRQLEEHLARFFQLPKALLFASGYHVNIGFFQSFFDARDFVFCDALISPSMAEGIRLCGAKTHSYLNNDLEDLQDKLKRSRSARFRAIVTSGVFPFDGQVADLDSICKLAKKFEATVVVDDSLGLGVIGQGGRGSCEVQQVLDKVDVITASLGRAIGCGMGGFAVGGEEIIDWLSQKSTSYLFSNSLSPAVVAGADKALELVEQGDDLRNALRQKSDSFRKQLNEMGFSVLPGQHPLVAVKVEEVVRLQKMINHLHESGIFLHGLCYPVVPEREARAIVHLTLEHSDDDIAQALDAFYTAGKELGLLGRKSKHDTGQHRTQSDSVEREIDDESVERSFDPEADEQKFEYEPFENELGFQAGDSKSEKDQDQQQAEAGLFEQDVELDSDKQQAETGQNEQNLEAESAGQDFADPDEQDLEPESAAVDFASLDKQELESDSAEKDFEPEPVAQKFEYDALEKEFGFHTEETNAQADAFGQNEPHTVEEELELNTFKRRSDSDTIEHMIEPESAEIISEVDSVEMITDDETNEYQSGYDSVEINTDLDSGESRPETIDSIEIISEIEPDEPDKPKNKR